LGIFSIPAQFPVAGMPKKALRSIAFFCTLASPMSQNLGFLTVIYQSRGDMIGGYLVLNSAGRPLEFHCTHPLQPDRIQEILYGNTLQPFLCGERIAQTLLSRSKLPAAFVMTNIPAVLPVQKFVELPIVYVFEALAKLNHVPATEPDAPVGDLFPVSKTVHEISEELNDSLKLFGIENANLQTKSDNLLENHRIPDVPGLATEQWKEVKIGNRLVAVPNKDEATWNESVEAIKQMSRTIDLAEPFTRIRLAIEEALRAA
jgi:hypothetical protein